MAKNSPKTTEVTGSVSAVEVPAGTLDTLPVVAPSEPAQTAAPKRFRVHLKAASPLAHNPAEVEAETNAEAWSKFCDLNGISSSDHEREITEVSE